MIVGIKFKEGRILYAEMDYIVITLGIELPPPEKASITISRAAMGTVHYHYPEYRSGERVTHNLDEIESISLGDKGGVIVWGGE